MTNPSRTNSRIGRLAWTGVLLAGCAALAACIAGCSKEEPPPVVQAPPSPPPPPPPPKIKTVAELMVELNIDSRVILPEESAPATLEARRAVLEFFDAFARADDKSLAVMLSHADMDGLQALIDSGQWKKTAERIKEIRVQTGPSPGGEPCALAVFQVGPTYQPQLWQYGLNSDGTAMFNAIATPPGIMNMLSGSDWIAAWHALLDKDLALADKPDEEIEIEKVNYSERTDQGSSGGGGGPGFSPGPGGPGNMPGKRPDTGRRYQRPGP